MDAQQLKKKYFEFFREKKHQIIPSASLIPEHDPTVLFTTAGMHPLVPFLMGQPHPSGKRLADVQKCIRTGDIDEVGDASHLTFFEMLGNWSLGDYFKKEAIEWSFEFLTSKKWLGMDKEKISVTCFAGDKDAPKDTEAAGFWKRAGIPDERIFFLPKKDNWWGPAGQTGPCGPDTEMFFDTGKERCGDGCQPGCGCGKYFEVWNDVFMQYNKNADGKFVPLAQKNVDTGMGVERTIAMLQGKKSVYETESFLPIIAEIKRHAAVKEFKESDDATVKSIRIIADHLRAAVFILGDENKVVPSNVDQGYILRRFIRRAVRHGLKLGIKKDFCGAVAESVISRNKEEWPELESNHAFIIREMQKEEEKFRKTLENGVRKFELMAKQGNVNASEAFLLFQSFGFPIELTQELAKEKGITVDGEGFKKEFEKHQQLSRVGAEKRFKGGLADHSEQTTKLHTATHLLNEALKVVLGRKDIHQKGSNITPERLRFDFNFDRKITDAELREVERVVNEKIQEGLAVTRVEMSVEEAKKIGAEGVFGHKYGDKVFVYTIGDFSKEICGGPHVDNTKEIGSFKIVKEEGVAAGVRRVKGVVS
ncbi:alanine--tRNA ligase [Candidatus Woesearchaeota archaeon]|nr:alanine--tRNA ligase [Candidatus Woesearchaeota archaeon]